MTGVHLGELKPIWEVASVEMLVPLYINCNIQYPKTDNSSHIKVLGYVNMIEGRFYLLDELPEGVDKKEFNDAVLHAIKTPPQPVIDSTVPDDAYERLSRAQSFKVPDVAFNPIPGTEDASEQDTA